MLSAVLEPVRAAPHRRRGVAWSWEQVVVGTLAAAVIALFLGPLHRLSLHLPRDENEGWNAYHAAAALAGGVLYPPPDSFVSNNYPPLSFYIVGGLGKVVGDNIVAGRIAALLCQLLVALNIYGLVRWFGGSRFWSSTASLLFLLYVSAETLDYVAMDDPQWLGHAFVTSGALLFLRAQSRARALSLLLASSLLCVAGLFVKHSLIILPLALFLWAVCYSRRGVAVWTLASLAWAVVALAAAVHAYGFVMFHDVFGHQRLMTLNKLLGDATRLLSPLQPTVLCTVLLGVIGWRDRYVKLILVYAALAGAIGLLFLAGAGVDVNVLFDLVIASSVACGLFGQRFGALLPVPCRLRAPAIIAGAFAILIFPSWKQALDQGRELVRQDRTELPQYRDLLTVIAAARGPVACETPSLCYWAGKDFTLDFFNYGMKLRTGVVRNERLKQRLARGDFAYIQTIGHPAAPHAMIRKILGDELSDYIDQRYMVTHELEGQFLLAPRH